MCGVAAAFAYGEFSPGVDWDELRAMRDYMAARGPDGAGSWLSDDGRVGLAHRRLAIIDLSDRGAQPMASADGRLVISFNGEIYNYRELRERLLHEGRVLRTDSDTEVILHLYELHGTGVLNMLRGMFAFALWDARERKMLLARDPLGIKPMYFAAQDGVLRAASQVKALLQANIDHEPDPAGHAGFFLWGSVPAPYTLYRRIRCLPAGHFMWVDDTGPQASHSYCDVAGLLAQADREPAQVSRHDAIEAMGAALRASAHAHLVSDVPVGVFLSSGLDSAMLASIVSGAIPTTRTLTLAFDEYAGTPLDEAPQAEAIAGILGTRHTTQVARRTDFLFERDRLVAAMDQPSIDGVNAWFIARAAAAQGLKVVMSGLGGDELLASYPSFRQIPQSTRWMGPLAKVPGLGLVARKLSAPLLRHFTSPKYAGLLEYGGTTGGAYLLRRGLHMPWELPHLMDPDMAREGWNELQPIAQLNRASPAGSTRLGISALEMSWYMRHQLLVDADWAGMAHSLEIRVPFVDIKLIKTCAPLIAKHPSITKREVVQAAAPGLPASVLDRPKTGFSVPVREWLGAPSASTRGLRGWSGYVYRRQWPHPFMPTPSGHTPRRVLVSTLAPGNGGVSAMTNFALTCLAAQGLEPVLAHYAPYSTWDPLESTCRHASLSIL